MPNYRRIRVEGGVYFFTVNLENRKSDFLVRHVDILRDAFRKINKTHPFEILAICILPNHFHTIWKLPEGDDNYPKRWRLIKAYFTKRLKSDFGYKHKVWQNRYWEHTIEGERDFQACFDYVHYNPVHHALVKDIRDWLYSSWHKFNSEHESADYSSLKWDGKTFGE